MWRRWLGGVRATADCPDPILVISVATCGSATSNPPPSKSPCFENPNFGRVDIRDAVRRSGPLRQVAIGH
jgi:hypothetical protein